MIKGFVLTLAAVLILSGCAISGQVRSKTYVPGYWVTSCIPSGSTCVHQQTYYPECWGLNTTGGSVCVDKEVYDRIPVGGYYTDETQKAA